jgi:hypothetical protein
MRHSTLQRSQCTRRCKTRSAECKKSSKTASEGTETVCFILALQLIGAEDLGVCLSTFKIPFAVSLSMLAANLTMECGALTRRRGVLPPQVFHEPHLAMLLADVMVEVSKLTMGQEAMSIWAVPLAKPAMSSILWAPSQFPAFPARAVAVSASFCVL